MELDVHEDNKRPLGELTEAAASFSGSTSGKTQRMKRIYLCLVIVLALTIVVVTIVATTFLLTPAESEAKPRWMSVSPKSPLSVTVTLRSKSDTSSGVGGQLQLCQGGACCVTDRFIFTAPTVIYMDDHQNCTKFGMDKDKEMSVKVMNEDAIKVFIYQFDVVLEDGESYNVLYKKSFKNSSWSQPFLLKVRDITNEQKMMLKINIKNLGANPSVATYVKNSRIEVKLRGDTRAGCFTNPLPWPDKEGTVNLDDLETLGPCFTYSISGAGDDLLVSYHAPNNTHFKVSKIVLKSYENQIYGWTVRHPTSQWANAEFDDDY